MEKRVLNVFVGESGGKLVVLQKRGVFPRHDHHFCFDSDRKIAERAPTEHWTFQLCVEDDVFYSHERPVCSLELVTSELSWFHGWIGNRESEGEVGIEIIGCG